VVAHPRLVCACSRRLLPAPAFRGFPALVRFCPLQPALSSLPGAACQAGASNQRAGSPQRGDPFWNGAPQPVPDGGLGGHRRTAAPTGWEGRALAEAVPTRPRCGGNRRLAGRPGRSRCAGPGRKKTGGAATPCRTYRTPAQPGRSAARRGSRRWGRGRRRSDRRFGRGGGLVRAAFGGGPAASGRRGARAGVRRGWSSFGAVEVVALFLVRDFAGLRDRLIEESSSSPRARELREQNVCQGFFRGIGDWGQIRVAIGAGRGRAGGVRGGFSLLADRARRARRGAAARAAQRKAPPVGRLAGLGEKCLAFELSVVGGWG
jgi:hypothetical protein